MFLLFLSDRITHSLFTLFFLLTRSRQAASGMLTFFYLPGTAVHELSHLILAEILRVPTGELSLTPKIEKNEAGHEEIRAGYLKIGKTDIFRRFIVGIAPLLVGLAALVGLMLIFQRLWPEMIDWKGQLGLILTIGYFLFSVSVNMFSSKKDIEDAPYLLPALGILCAALVFTAWYLGVRLTLTGQAFVFFNSILQNLTKALGFVCAINLIVLLINGLFLRGILKILKLKINNF